MSVDTPEPDSSVENDLSTGGAVSRQTNNNKSVNGVDGGSEASEDLDLHTKAKIERCISDFVSKYPEKAFTPLATGDRRKLRRVYAEIEKEEWVEDLRLDDDVYKAMMYPNPRPSGVSDGEVTPFLWVEALELLLYKYAATEETAINLSKTLFNAREEHSVLAESRWQPEYQKRYKAQLEGSLRELTGGERPSGGYTEAIFDNPYLVLITLSGSSVPDGTRIGAVDLLDELSSTFSNHTYHAVRNTLRALGFDSDEWVYDRRAEPHASERGDKTGTNACYGHEHVVLVVDGKVSEEELRPIVETHVEHCEFAGEGAHGEGAIEVSPADEIDDIGGYVADYASVAPVGLLDREVEFQAFAAAAAAANYRTVTRSEAAREAAKVDRCRQRYESGESTQELDHGEEVRYDDGEIVCLACGCTHGIDQHQTLADYRKPDNADSTPTEPAIADGGFDMGSEEMSLRELWRDANSAVRIGCDSVARICNHEVDSAECPLCCAEGETISADTPLPTNARTPRSVETKVESFGCDREPEWMNPDWQVDSVTVRGETHAAGGGNGMEYVETETTARFNSILDAGTLYECECNYCAYGDKMANHLYSAHGIDRVDIARECVEKSDELRCGSEGGALPPEKCIPPRLLKGSEPWERSDEISEEDVRSGELPPPEVIGEQLSEVSGLRKLAVVECDECGWQEKVETHVDSVECPTCTDRQSSRSALIPIPVEDQMVTVDCPSHDWQTEISIPMHRERGKDRVTCPQCLIEGGDAIPLPRDELPETATVECSQHEWETRIPISEGGAECPECKRENIDPVITVPDTPETFEEAEGGCFELSGGRVTPKVWDENWYENRHGDTDAGDDASVVSEVLSSVGRPLTVDQKKIVERIRMVEGAHPDMGAIELAAKYDAIEHIDIVKATVGCVRDRD